jgi:uncharacterized protein YidB (DUF937 family)
MGRLFHPTGVRIMGLLDSVLGSAMGAMTGGGQGGQGGGGDLLMRVIGSLLQGQGGGSAGGGLGGLLQQLQQGGLGDAVQSWVGTGENLPVSSDQLLAALGGDRVSELAQQAGMSQGDLMGQLSHYLPQVIDQLTPQGEVPSGGGDMAGMLGGLLGGLLKR